MQQTQCNVTQCLGPWLDGMPDPGAIAEGLIDMDTWLTGTLTPAVTAVDSDLTAYSVSSPVAQTRCH